VVGHRCVRCGDQLVEIELIIDGHPMTMRSCTKCDHRTWIRDGHAVDLPAVLSGISSARTRYRRDIALDTARG